MQKASLLTSAIPVQLASNTASIVLPQVSVDGEWRSVFDARDYPIGFLLLRVYLITIIRFAINACPNLTAQSGTTGIRQVLHLYIPLQTSASLALSTLSSQMTEGISDWLAYRAYSPDEGFENPDSVQLVGYYTGLGRSWHILVAWGIINALADMQSSPAWRSQHDPTSSVTTVIHQNSWFMM